MKKQGFPERQTSFETVCFHVKQRWLSNSAGAYGEIVRQQYVFSRMGITREILDYQVDLEDQGAIELSIKRNLGDQGALASLGDK